jgi:hypothetical protein
MDRFEELQKKARISFLLDNDEYSRLYRGYKIDSVGNGGFTNESDVDEYYSLIPSFDIDSFISI